MTRSAFTILEVTADCQEPMIPRRITQPSVEFKQGVYAEPKIRTPGRPTGPLGSHHCISPYRTSVSSSKQSPNLSYHHRMKAARTSDSTAAAAAMPAVHNVVGDRFDGGSSVAFSAFVRRLLGDCLLDRKARDVTCWRRNADNS